jgi:hypothetical protein
MKQLATSYSFNVLAKTVTLTGLNVPLNYVLLIVNATRNAIIYNLADTATGAQSYLQGVDSVITLKADLSGMSNADKLTIFYDDGKESALIAVQGPKGDTGAAGTTTWSGITEKPTDFTPATHASTHATGGSDALTPADIGASATGHTHSAADIEFATQDAGTGNEWTPVDANEVAGRANNAFHSVNSVGADVANHISNFSNPHSVTASQVGAEPAFTTLPIDKGGTGSTTAENALTALGAVAKTGDTMTGKLTLPASTTVSAPINIPHGSNPTSPSSGDLWLNGPLRYNDPTGTTRIVADTNRPNTFTSNQIVSTTSESAALRVTQLGAGESFRVEDETSPDSTAFVISNKGNVGIGVDPDASVGLSVNSTGIKFSDGSIQSSSSTGIKTVLAQTTGNVSGTFSGNEFLVTGTATLVVDGYIPPVGGIVVFASQAAPAQNGFWRVAVNNGQTQPILERPTWFSSTTTNISPLVYITRFGATQGGFVMALTGPLGLNIVVGTTALTVHRISGRAPTVGIVAIPSASNSAGTVGQVAVDDANNFLYVCTAANVWKRTALTTF